MSTALRLRFDYVGRMVPPVRAAADGRNAAVGPDAVWLRTPAQLEGRHLP
jgi:hypothetical protein